MHMARTYQLARMQVHTDQQRARMQILVLRGQQRNKARCVHTMQCKPVRAHGRR